MGTPLCLPRTTEAWEAMRHELRNFVERYCGHLCGDIRITECPTDDGLAAFEFEYEPPDGSGIRNGSGTLRAAWNSDARATFVRVDIDDVTNGRDWRVYPN